MFSFFRKQVTNFFNFLKTIYKLFLLILSKFIDFFNFEFSDLDLFRKKNANFILLRYDFYSRNDIRNSMNTFLFKEKSFLYIDLINYLYLSFKYVLSDNNTNLFRSYFRALNTKSGFYFNFNSLKNNKTFLKTLKNIFMSGFKSIWLGLKFWLIPGVIGFVIIYYSMVLRCVPFNKIVAFWIIFGMIAYWILSGFVFFIKKYQYSKFTTSIQRFWRRTYIIFWLIEFSLFIVYVYLTLNANQESFYMFDQIQVFKTHLFSWRSFLLKIFPLTILLILGYFLLLSLKWNILSKNSLLVIIITLIIVNTVWVEFYQFFHVVNYYGNFNWVYEADEKMWSLELESRKTRTVNHYVMLLLLLKFWHIVLIVAFWVFFVLRGLEIGRLRYPLLSANLQNFLILYLFAWVNMFPWVKFILRRYIDMPYYWFYVNNRDLGYRVFFNDIKLFYYGVVEYFSYTTLPNFLSYNFINWSIEDENFLFSYRKSSIKNSILISLEHDFKN
jgi:hypothetical protein